MRRMTGLRRREVVAGAACLLAPPASAGTPRATTWTFDRLDSIGGEAAHVEGAPGLVDTPAGRAVLFDGVDDALFVDRHPLAGAEAFTFEAVFRPDGGAFEQRWFHLASDDVEGGATGVRMMFELRVVDAGWYLDAFVAGPGYKQALVAPDKLHPIGRWTHVAQTCDGRSYRSYVNGQLQAQAQIAFAPQGPGRASIGTRINRKDYFRGAVRMARFTPRALEPEAFLPPPKA